jgi:uncharacterized protein YdhG (YjbR/CyaY superfamily)
MAKTDFKSVDQYLASQPESTARVLKVLRRTIRKAIPQAEETISYGIPTYKLHGRSILYFGGWKEHYSIYPSTDRLVAALKEQRAPYEVAKGTIRFPLSEPVPTRLIGRIAKLRAMEVAERKKTKATALRKR